MARNVVSALKFAMEIEHQALRDGTHPMLRCIHPMFPEFEHIYSCVTAEKWAKAFAEPVKEAPLP
jgi:hypothetical protein